MFDDVEILPPPSASRWPLHPQPTCFEHLDTFVRRLARAHGVGLTTFCRVGLGITRKEWRGCHDDPPAAVLARLSTGSGVPVHRLRNMTAQRRYTRLRIAMHRHCREHPDELPAWNTRGPQQTPG